MSHPPAVTPPGSDPLPDSSPGLAPVARSARSVAWQWGATLSLSAVAVGLALLLPLLVHLLPWTGTAPLGAVVLPLFLTPVLVLAARLGRWPALATAAAPLLNHLLTGLPAQDLLWRLVLEMVLFTYLLCAVWKWSRLRVILVPVACLLAIGTAQLLISLQAHTLTGLTDAVAVFLASLSAAASRSWPGLALLASAGLLSSLLPNPRAPHRRGNPA